MRQAAIVIIFLVSTLALAFVEGLFRGSWSVRDLGYQASAWAAFVAPLMSLGAVAGVLVAHIATLFARRRGLTLSSRACFALTAACLAVFPGAFCWPYAFMWPFPLVLSAVLAGSLAALPRAAA